MSGSSQIIFTDEEINKILKDLIENLRDLYRIWFKKVPEIEVSWRKERLSVGAIQYKLLEYEDFFNKLKKAVLNLNRNPHIKIEREILYSSSYEIEDVSPEMFPSYISLYEKNEYGGKILAPKKIITENTYENRFVKGTLIKIYKGINELLDSLKILDKKEEYKEKIEEMIKKILQRKKEINFLLNLEFINEIDPEFEVKLTPVIKNNPYYNTIYKLYLKWNQYCFPFESGELNLYSFEEWKLYELWVFFEIFKQLKQKFGKDFELKNWFEIEGRKIKLKIGEMEKEREREVNWRKQNLSLYYQKEFVFQKNKKGIGSYTIPVKPDIVLWNKRKNEIIIFDVKKQTVESLLKEKNGKYRTGIAQLHQYKEAIINFETKERVVKGAYAVIPKKTPFKEYEKFFDKNYRKEYGFGIYVFEILGEKEEVEIWKT
jgi:hypothetical protein